MKILTALTYYHPHWTGLTTYARRIAEGLAARGHDVTVLTTQHDPSLARDEVVGGVRVVRLPALVRVSRAMVMPTFPSAARRLVAESDLVQVHSPMPEAAFLVALSRLLDTPTLVTHQGDVVMPIGTLNSVVQGTMNLNLGYAVGHADAVVTHSADYAAHSKLLQSRGRPVHAIAPPTTIPEPAPDRVAAWRTELGLDGTRIVGFAGRFVEEKGFDFLLEAMPAIRAAVPDVRFLFAGETNVAYERFYDRCRPLLEQNAEVITSVGLLLDRQQLADFYAMCELFVLPSRTDCFAGVQVESLLCGTPLVTADIPGAREVVWTTGMGRLVPSRDPAALAEGIVAELGDPRPRPQRSKVLGHFDADECIAEYERLADALVARRPIDEPARTTAASRSVSTPRGLGAPDRTLVERHLNDEPDMAYRRRVPLLVEFLELRDGDRVLDCGSGFGALSALLAQLRELRIVAADEDLSRLERASTQSVRAALVNADACRLPFADASFDRVLVSELLEHLDDDLAGMHEVARVLEPGGVAAISVPHANYPAAWDPVNRALETFGLPPRRRGLFGGHWTDHVRLYLPADVCDLVTAAGLDVEALVEHTAHAAPFNPHLVYGIGKPLLERGLLPERWGRSADRFPDAGGENDGAETRFDPVSLGARVLRRIDRRNERSTGNEGRFVGVVVRARKPDPQ